MHKQCCEKLKLKLDLVSLAIYSNLDSTLSFNSSDKNSHNSGF